MLGGWMVFKLDGVIFADSWVIALCCRQMAIFFSILTLLEALWILFTKGKLLIWIIIQIIGHPRQQALTIEYGFCCKCGKCGCPLG